MPQNVLTYNSLILWFFMPYLKRILVTGGAGFLGSHLCECLVETGHDVICVDNFFTSQKRNIAHLLDC